MLEDAALAGAAEVGGVDPHRGASSRLLKNPLHSGEEL